MSKMQTINTTDVNSNIAVQRPKHGKKEEGGDPSNNLDSYLFFGPLALSIQSDMAYLENSVKLAVMWGEAYENQSAAYLAFNQDNGQAQLNGMEDQATATRDAGWGQIGGAISTGVVLAGSVATAWGANTQVKTSGTNIANGNSYMKAFDDNLAPDRVLGPEDDITNLDDNKRQSVNAKIAKMQSHDMRSNSLADFQTKDASGISDEDAVRYMDDAQIARAQSNVKSNIKAQMTNRHEANTSLQTVLSVGQTVNSGLGNTSSGIAAMYTANANEEQGAEQKAAALYGGAAQSAQSVMQNDSQQNQAAQQNIQQFVQLVNAAIQASSYRA